MNTKNSVIVILFLIIALGASAAWSMGQRPKSVQVQHEVYICPMHPEIKQDHPGNCPICGMTLIKKDSKSARTGLRCSCCGMKKG